MPKKKKGGKKKKAKKEEVPEADPYPQFNGMTKEALAQEIADLSKKLDRTRLDRNMVQLERVRQRVYVTMCLLYREL